MVRMTAWRRTALLDACLDGVLAQVDVGLSNSVVEAFWRGQGLTPASHLPRRAFWRLSQSLWKCSRN